VVDAECEAEVTNPLRVRVSLRHGFCLKHYPEEGFFRIPATFVQPQRLGFAGRRRPDCIGDRLAPGQTMLAYFETNLGWTELLKRTAKETQSDNGLGLAAQLAYYFFLALFPTLLFLIALAGAFATQGLVTRVVDLLAGAAPPDVVAIVREQLISLAQGDQGGIMTFGVVAALWSSSAAMVALIDALNRAYDVEDARPWWKQRLTAILLTAGVAIFILASFALVIAGPELAETIASRVGLGPAFEWTWKVLQWPVVFALVAGAFGLVYYFAPDVDQDFVFLTPGSALATVLWLIGSLGFRYYVVNFGSYNETYGTVGGIMVLLLWLYISGLCVIVGAELNAEIEHASAHGKDRGEKTPGQRKTIGARAEREFKARHSQSAPAPVPAPAAPARTPRTLTTAAYARTGVLFGGLIAALFRRRIKQ
jgi:membrane protein